MNRRALKTLLLQDVGKYVAVGLTEEFGSGDFYATRFNSDASTDTSFGENGYSVTRHNGVDDPQIGMIMNDGSVIAAGYGDGFVATFAKYQKDGGLDLTFGSNGLSSTSLLPAAVVRDLYQVGEYIYAVCTTTTINVYSMPQSIGVLKIDQTGNFDTNFGNAGSQIFDVSLSGWKLFIEGLKNNELLIIGAAGGQPVLTRITTDGAPTDYFSTMDSPWVAINNQPSLSEISGVVVDKSENIFIAGSASSSDGSDVYIAKVDKDGNLNTTYGTNAGYLLLDLGGVDYAQALCVQNDSKLVVAGTSFGLEGLSGYAMTVSRFMPNGVLDKSFGKQGTLVIPGLDGGASLLIVTDIKIDKDGSFLVLYTIESASAFVRISSKGQVISQYGAGSDGADSFYGSDSQDILRGNSGNDVLSGDSGNDSLYGGAGDDQIVGGKGVDSTSYSDADAGVTINLESGIATSSSQDAGVGSDSLSGIENVDGSAYADTIVGDTSNNVVNSGNGNDEVTTGDGNDVVYAGGGDDLIIGGDGKGDDRYFGGEGTDKIKYLSATWGISVDLGKGTAASLINPNDATNKDASGTGKDSLNSIENLIAGSYADLLIGSKDANQIEGMGGADKIDGKEGNDTLLGGAGNDTLIGGVGRDSLTGGSDNDRFVFDSIPSVASNTDTISDFGDGTDKLILSKSIFKFAKGIINKDGSLNSSSSALNQYLVIANNSGTWSVAYDADGAGTKSTAIKFADVTLAGTKTSLDFSDFIVV